MSRRLRSIGIVAIAALVALFALLPIAGAAPRAAETKNVAVRDFEFAPAAITVNVGDSIMWMNEGQRPHTATANDGTFDSGNLNNGQSFSFTFTKAGTISYVCRYHDSMQGTITVQDAAQAPAPAAPAQQATGSLDAADQAVMDGSITIARVSSSGPGWIAVHLDDGGKPGKVIGHGAVRQGDSTNVKVKLDENVAAGAKVWPMLHMDAGTAGTYEFPGPDAPVKDASGNIVMKQITITAAGAGDQRPLPSTGVAEAPRQLPTTGGESTPIALLIGALALLLGGALLTLRMRRSA